MSRLKENELRTIREAKQYLKEGFSEGTNCPCCGQRVKLYKRGVSSGGAMMLINLYHKKDEWTYAGDVVEGVNSGDFYRLQLWDLVAIKPKDESDNSKAGTAMFKITEQGKLFVENKLTIIKYKHVFNGTVWGESGDQVNIIHALNNKFNYIELMRL